MHLKDVALLRCGVKTLDRDAYAQVWQIRRALSNGPRHAGALTAFLHGALALGAIFVCAAVWHL
jgi:hypothetical protein